MSGRRKAVPSLDGLLPDRQDELVLAWAQALETGAKQVIIEGRGEVAVERLRDALAAHYRHPFGPTINPLVSKVIGFRTPLLAPQGDVQNRPRIALAALHLDGTLALIRSQYIAEGKSDLELLAYRPTQLPLVQTMLEELQRCLDEARSHVLPGDVGERITKAHKSPVGSLKVRSSAQLKKHAISPVSRARHIVLGSERPPAALLPKTRLEKLMSAAHLGALSLAVPPIVHAAAGILVPLGVPVEIEPVGRMFGVPYYNGLELAANDLIEYSSILQSALASPLEPLFDGVADNQSSPDMISALGANTIDAAITTAGYLGVPVSVSYGAAQLFLMGGAAARRKLLQTFSGPSVADADAPERRAPEMNL